MQTIGLTGGIASGKSTVSETMQELGATVLNADLIGHEAYLPGKDAYKDIIAAWGEDLIDPESKLVDRRKLGGIVFGDPEALQTLNRIVWPRIYEMVADRFEGFKNDGADVVVLEAAVLIEANWMPLVDEVWVTTTNEDEASRRLQARNEITEEQALTRIRAQITNQERLKHADVVIDTNHTIPEVQERVRELWHARVHSLTPGS